MKWEDLKLPVLWGVYWYICPGTNSGTSTLRFEKVITVVLSSGHFSGASLGLILRLSADISTTSLLLIACQDVYFRDNTRPFFCVVGNLIYDVTEYSYEIHHLLLDCIQFTSRNKTKFHNSISIIKLTAIMSGTSWVKACTLWKLAIKLKGIQPLLSIFLLKKKSFCKFSSLK